MFPWAVVPLKNVDYTIEKLQRVARLEFKSAVVRLIIVNDRNPTFPEFDPIWREFEDLGIALEIHTLPALETLTQNPVFPTDRLVLVQHRQEMQPSTNEELV